MTTRQVRLAEFTSSGEPPTQACEILCEDHNGTYVPQFMGRFSDGVWRNSNTGDNVEVRVIGWRPQGRELGGRIIGGKATHRTPEGEGAFEKVNTPIGGDRIPTKPFRVY